MSEESRERDFYRRQSDELGSQVLRLQQDLIRVRRESRRNRITATLVRELYQLARAPLGSAEVEARCLRIVVDRLAVDCAVILARAAGGPDFEVKCSLGFGKQALEAFRELRLPAATGEWRGAAVAEPAPRYARPADVAEVLWAGARDGEVVLLVANTASERLRRESFDAEDRQCLLVALDVYLHIVELKDAEAALRASEARHRAIVNSVSDGIVVAAIDSGRILDVNERLCELLGRSAETFAELTIADLNPADPLFGEEPGRHILRRTLAGIHQRFEWRLQRPDGNAFWAEVRLRCAGIGGQDRLLIVIRDITDRRRAEEQLQYDALHDNLTGLANRALIMDRVEQALARHERDPDYLFALASLDLDRFKLINDSMGHGVGDQLLMAVANRLRESLRPGDTLGRLGGDEIVILFDDIGTAERVNTLADSLQDDLREPLRVGGVELRTSASLGIALCGDGYQRWDEMLRDADLAMYEAKAAGKAQHCRFHPSMHHKAVERVQMESELRHAVAENALELHYQPLISLASGRLVGFEALVRWQHPARGLVMPGEFIPLAEESGLIVPLGYRVLEQACEQMANWQRRFHACDELTLSVNLSRWQLVETDLVERIGEILQRTGCDPRQLGLEFTESAIMESAVLARTALSGLRALGIQLSMDDFGTGYSSLSFLHQFPIDVLKIDRSFVHRMNTEENGVQIVSTIVTLGHSLNLKVVAEGVEAPGAADRLRLMGCDMGQGFLFARPMPAAAATEVLGASYAKRP